MATIGSDTFARANQSGWGTASDGQAWFQLAGVLTAAIASNTGTVTNDPNHDNWFALGTKTQIDTDCLVRFKLQDKSHDIPGLMFRSNGASTANTTNAYRIVYNGTTLGLRRINNGSSTTLGTNFAFTVNNGSLYWIRGRIVGSTFMARIWADGSTEPTTWGVTATDGSPLLAAGRFGIYAIINTSTTDIMSFDSFTATDTLAAQGSQGSDFAQGRLTSLIQPINFGMAPPVLPGVHRPAPYGGIMRIKR